MLPKDAARQPAVHINNHRGMTRLLSSVIWPLRGITGYAKMMSQRRLQHRPAHVPYRDGSSSMSASGGGEAWTSNPNVRRAEPEKRRPGVLKIIYFELGRFRRSM